MAGNIDWEPLRDQVERLFGDWQGGEPPALKLGKPPAAARSPGQGHHADADRHRLPERADRPSRLLRGPGRGATCSRGGMSARLFTEVREKRGLCYSVWASYQTFKDRASILCYAGTTNERAQETLDVTLGELQRLQDGIEAEEVERVQAGLKSSLIMQEESTSARAGTLASDWYYLGRVRSFDEIQAAINALTPRGSSTTCAAIRRRTSPSSHWGRSRCD